MLLYYFLISLAVALCESQAYKMNKYMLGSHRPKGVFLMRKEVFLFVCKCQKYASHLKNLPKVIKAKKNKTGNRRFEKWQFWIKF